MRIAALSCFFLLLSGMAGAGADAGSEEPTQVYVADGELVYVGVLDPQANARLFTLYDSLKDKPAVLSIRSRGGTTSYGLALGRWVRDHKLDVKVMEYCMSSCANYVFPAGIHKLVSNFAVIGFHGGLSSKSFEFDAATQKMLGALPSDKRKAMLDGIASAIKDDAKQEQAYFKALGVRGDYVTLGQEDRYQRRQRSDPHSVGWTYSLDDFARLGVRDITVINPPWRPGSALKNMSFEVLRVEE
jgi:hypothetical protein